MKKQQSTIWQLFSAAIAFPRAPVPAATGGRRLAIISAFECRRQLVVCQMKARGTTLSTSVVHVGGVDIFAPEAEDLRSFARLFRLIRGSPGSAIYVGECQKSFWETSH